MKWPLIINNTEIKHLLELNRKILHWIRWHPKRLHCIQGLVADHNATPFYSLASVAKMVKLQVDTVVFVCIMLNHINEIGVKGRRCTHKRYELSLDNRAVAALRSRNDREYDHAAAPY